MVGLKSRRCQAPGCSRVALFGDRGSHTPDFCKDHAQAGMIDLRNKRCESHGCWKIASFAMAGTNRPTHCGEHAETNLINVRKKSCQAPECSTIPSYAEPGSGRPLFCRLHAAFDMMNVTNYRRCETEGCSKVPSFAEAGSGRARFCGKHAGDDMTNVVMKRCETEGCDMRAYFGFPGTRSARSCRKHAGATMVDVRRNQCQAPDCSSCSTFGILGQPPSHCAKHRTDEMVLHPRRRCQEKNCSNSATHGIKGPEHCEVHALKTERDLVSRPCRTCGIEHILQDGLCQACGFWSLHGSLHLYKQHEVEKVLRAAGHPPDQTDVTIDRGTCGRERPDFLWDCGSHFLILEVDENQHLSNFEECECKRMVNILNSLGGTPALFIRYNPDRYRPSGTGEKTRRTAGETQGKRHDTLMRWVKWARKHKDARPRGPEDMLRFVQLFFDGWDGTGSLERIPTENLLPQ